MDSRLQNVCETFIRNRDLLRDSFRYEGMAMHLMGAAVMTASGGRLGIKEYVKCEDYIDSKAGVFSTLRGVLKMPMVINMALSGKPEQYFETVQRCYSDITDSVGHKDERLFLAAMIIASNAPDNSAVSDMIETAYRIYDKTDSAARFFADVGDFVTAASVAAFGVTDVDAYARELELCKEELDSPAGIGKVPEDLCMLLAAKPGAAEEKCMRVKEISAALGDRKLGLGSGDAAPMLAELAILDMSPEDIAENVCEADRFLKGQKGFGFMGAGAAMRHMYAAMMVCTAFGAGESAGDAAANAALADAVTNRYGASLLNSQIMLQTQMLLLTQTSMIK